MARHISMRFRYDLQMSPQLCSTNVYDVVRCGERAEDVW